VEATGKEIMLTNAVATHNGVLKRVELLI